LYRPRVAVTGIVFGEKALNYVKSPERLFLRHSLGFFIHFLKVTQTFSAILPLGFFLFLSLI
jgi:hypothetical protein